MKYAPFRNLCFFALFWILHPHQTQPLLAQDNPLRFFVGNTQTGGYGITLTAASTVIYYSNNYDLERRLQSEDRAHRIGQTNEVDVFRFQMVSSL